MATNLNAEGEVRFSKNIKIENHLLQARVSRTGGSWRVSLSEKKGARVLLKSTIPDWVAASYYDYTLLSRTIDGYPIIIFEARPSPGLNAPKNAEILQFAWMRKNTHWKTIASTQTSILEGTDQLQFRQENSQLALVRIQSKDSNLFCGERLGVYKVFNPDEDAFYSRLRLDSLTKGTLSLQASLPSTTFEASIYNGFTRWAFASSKENRDRSGTLIRPNKLGDGSIASSWSEGKKDGSRGEFVTARLNDALKMTGFRIFPGSGNSADDFLASAKPTKILVSVSNGARFQIDLPITTYETLKKTGGLSVKFPKPIRSSCLSIIILESTQSTQATSISEISPITELDGLDKKVAALVVVEKLLGANQTRTNRKLAQLTYPLRAELAEVLTEVLKTGSDEDRKRIIPLLRSLPSEAALPILVQLFEKLPSKDPSYRLLKPLLATHSKSSAALIEIYKNRPPQDAKKRLDLIRLLGRIKGDGPSALLGSLGDGDLELRQEKMRSIARGGARMLPDLFSIAHKNPNSSKSEDALTTINKIAKHIYRNRKGELQNQKITKIFHESKTRKRRALAAKSASYFSFDGDFAFYQKLLSNADPALRRFGTLGLSNLMTPRARLMLEKALNDPSPDVRIEAIHGFLKRLDRAESTEAIVRFVEQEKWVQGIRFGCATLAEIGSPATLQTLGQFVVLNQSNKSGIAARALVKAKKSISVIQIENLLGAPDTDLRLTFSLIEMLGIQTAPLNESLLLKLIKDKNYLKKHDDRARYKIEKRAIFALGRQRSRSASEELLSLLKTEPNGSKVQATILRAFAFQSDPWVLRELRTFDEGMSESTKGIYLDTLNAIQRRIDLKKLSDTIEDTSK